MSRDVVAWKSRRAQASTMRLRSLIIVTSLVILFAAWPSAAFAKRGVPKPVPPLVHDGIEYRAPHVRMGIVEAVDTASGRKLWETRVYQVLIDPLMERDVQDVFITSLQVQDGKLLVSNEAGKTFRLDLKTGRVEGAMRYWIPFFCMASALAFAAFLCWRRLASRRQRLVS